MDNKYEKFIKECKLKANSDWKSANVLLKNGDNFENVAYLFEQAYEKNLKAAYMKYQSEIKNEPFDAAHERIKNHGVNFIIDMICEIHMFYGEILVKKVPAIKEFLLKHKDIIQKSKYQYSEIKEQIELSPSSADQIVENIKSAMDNLKQHIKRIIKIESCAVKFISKLNKNTIRERNSNPGLLDVFTMLEKWLEESPERQKYVDILDVDKWKEYVQFLDLVRALAPYTIPHVVLSRYPLPECKMKNLEAYRKADSKELCGFLEKLSVQIKSLSNTTDSFTERIAALKSIS